MVGVCRFSCPHDLFFRDALTSVGDIIADGSVEEPRVLEHHAECAAQLPTLELRNVHAINRDFAAVDFIETHQQVHEGRFASAGGADNRNHLARLDIDIHILHQHGIFFVAELDMLELNRSLRSPNNLRINSLGNFLRLIEQFKDTLGRGHR